MSTQTLQQIQRQLDAFGCARYEVQPLPPKGIELPKQGFRHLTADQIMTNSFKWARAKNLEGYDIFIRPEPLPGDLAHPFAFVDDVSLATAARMAADGLPLSILVESSPNNFHGWVHISHETLTKDEMSAVGLLLARRYGGDPGSTDWRHYGRLAGFTNRKPSRRQANGLPPWVFVREWSRSVAPDGEGFLAEAREMLEQDTKAAAVAREAAISLHKSQITTISAHGTALDVLLAGRNASTACKDGRPDESAKDFAGTLRALRFGFTVEEVSAALALASPGVDRRGKDYVRVTVEKAAANVANTPSTLMRSPFRR